jgi:hypothetical protein
VPVVLFLLVGALITLRTVRNLNVAGHPEVPGYGLHDFRDVIYYPAVAVLDGRNPYDPAVFRSAYPVARPLAPYAPTMLMLHVPFALLPYQVAEWAHFAMNLALMLVLAYLALDACGLSTATAAVFGIGALILLSRPAHMTLYIGQSSAYLVTATYCALLFAERRPVLAGVALAIACAKPTFGIPLCAVLLVRGDRAALVWGLALAAVAGAVMVAVLVPAAGGIGPLVSSIRDSYAHLMQDPSANATSSIIRIDAVALVGRLLGGSVGPAAESLATLALIAAGTAAAWRISRAGGADARLRSTCVACVTILACMYHQSYDGLMLTLPVVAIASGRVGEVPLARALALVAMVVPAANYLATDTLVDALGVEGTARAIVGSVNGAAMLVAFVAVTMLAVGRSGVARPVVADVAG